MVLEVEEFESKALRDAGFIRKIPSQKRSRERYETILNTAEKVLIEKGGDNFSISDVVDASGIAFGSIYQYFTDRLAIIGILAFRHNLEGRRCVEEALERVSDESGLQQALDEIVDGYYEMFLRDPVMKILWGATQTDKSLQAVDREDMEYLAGLLDGCLAKLRIHMKDDIRAKTARLVMEMIASTVRYAITLEEKEALETLSLFKGLAHSMICKSVLEELH